MKEQTLDIKELHQDDLNFNKGSYEGEKLMNKSFAQFGAGRSILLDKDNNIIAGNKTALAAEGAGIKKVRVIETTGDELIAVKRTDIDLDSKEGRELAIADNSTASINLVWDEENLEQAEAMFEDLDFTEFGYKDNKKHITSQGEIDIDEFDEDQELKVKLTFEQYEKVTQKLLSINSNLSEALLETIGYYAEENV